MLGISGCVSFSMNDDEIARVFASRSLSEPVYASYSLGNRTIGFAETGNREMPMVVFIHGSPGSWDNFITFMADADLRHQAHLVAPDRPGFGQSELGGPALTLTEQSDVLAPLLDRQNTCAPRKAILVGHSLGGPVAVRMAVDHPHKVDGLILVAPSISPELEVHRWYNKAADNGFVRLFLPGALKTSNDEIMPLRGELEAMEPLLPLLRIPVIVIQGEQDTLVPPGNADYVKNTFAHSAVEVYMHPELNHFIPWTRPDLIKDAILKLLQPEEAQK